MDAKQWRPAKQRKLPKSWLATIGHEVVCLLDELALVKPAEGESATGVVEIALPILGKDTPTRFSISLLSTEVSR